MEGTPREKALRQELKIRILEPGIRYDWDETMEKNPKEGDDSFETEMPIRREHRPQLNGLPLASTNHLLNTSG